MVIDALAISEIIEPRSTLSLAGHFRRMPRDEAWAGPPPYLIAAWVELAAGRMTSPPPRCVRATACLRPCPPMRTPHARLAAALIRVTTFRRNGDLAAAAAAVSDAEALVSQMPADKLAKHPEIRGRVLADRGAVELWPGHLDQAARFLDAGVAAATSPGGEHERAACLGYLALVEALRGQLRHAAKLADQAAATLADQEQRPPQHQDLAALAALAWVHLERNRPGGSRQAAQAA